MLMIANAIILFVLAGAFLTAGMGRRTERYWHSWSAGNVALGIALLFFMAGPQLPHLVVTIVPNLLLVIGFGLRWRAAREFGGRPAPKLHVIVPGALFLALCLSPWFFGSYRAAFTIVNAMLCIQAVLIAREFWRDRGDGLPSRYGLILAYGVVGLSFGARAVQGLFFGAGMPLLAPDDFRLQIHLAMALFHTTASGAFALSIAYERSARELLQTAMSDDLTGLPNRRAFVARLRALIDAPEQPRFAVALFDIDHFKRINDEHGHGGGDEALRACASIFARRLPEGAFVARIGGEEFGVLLPNASPAESRRAADQLRQSIKDAVISYDGRRMPLTVSAGICHSEGAPRAFDAIMRAADARLYDAKDAGRDRVTFEAA